MSGSSKKLDKINWKAYGPFPVFGVDEVGRGCLAGPVYAAALSLRSDMHLGLLTDSKLLSEKRRESIAPLLREEHDWFVASASIEEIDELNILQASLLAMKRAVEGLALKIGISPGHILVDGTFKIPGLLSLKQTPIVKGDLRAEPISAASIIAKVHRDQVMRELAEVYPQYDFLKNKGYGSEKHRKAIEVYGPTPCHRKSFSGVREFLPRS